MQIQQFRCPNCGGPLQYNPYRPLTYCQYCGEKLYLNDGVQRVKIDRTERHEYKYKNETIESNDAEMIKWMAILFLGAGGIGLVVYLIEKVSNFISSFG